MITWVEINKNGLPLQNGGIYIIKTHHKHYYAVTFNTVKPETFITLNKPEDKEYIFAEDVEKWRKIE